MMRWNSSLCALAVLLVLFGCTAGVSGSLLLFCFTYANVKEQYRLPTRVRLVCCEQVSRMPIPRNIELIGYKHQNALAPCVEAVIFYSKTDKFCSDPAARWIQRRKQGLSVLIFGLNMFWSLISILMRHKTDEYITKSFSNDLEEYKD